MTTVLDWISLAIAWLMLNAVLLVKFQQAICIAGSAVCELFHWTKASKWFGTFALVDLGRIIRAMGTMWPALRGLLGKTTSISAWAITTAIALTASVIGGQSCAPKNTFGAQCPANAICDKVDFGTGAVTICLSPSDLTKVQAAAARSRAATKASPDGGAS